MPSRRNSKAELNPHKRTNQGECGPDPEQQHSETDLPSGPPPTRRGIADHPNRGLIVIQPDQSYIPRPGPGRDHIISPWQVNAVVGAAADRVDEVVEEVRDLDEPPSESDFQADSRQPASGSWHHCERGNHTIVPSDNRAPSNHAGSQDSHGKSASPRQGLVNRESGMSLDGFPSRSVEEGGVSGLYQSESGTASGGDTASDAADSPASPSHASAAGSSSAADGTTIHTARAVSIRPVRVADQYPFDGEAAVHRPPLPAELDRMDGLLDDALSFWNGVSPGLVAPTQLSDEGEGEMLTANRESIVTVPDQDPDNADGLSIEVEHAHPRRSSPVPSDSSIAETVFDVRRPTPPPRPPGVTTLPSPQRRAVTAAGPSGGLRRGGAYPGLENEQEEAVPAVLVPGGGRGWLGLGGSQPPPQVSRRQGRDDPDDEEVEKERRRPKAREE